jgi:hypothetical protein
MTKRDKATIMQAIGSLAKGEKLLFDALKAVITGNAGDISIEESESWFVEANLLYDRLLEWYEEEGE